LVSKGINFWGNWTTELLEQTKKTAEKYIPTLGIKAEKIVFVMIDSREKLWHFVIQTQNRKSLTETMFVWENVIAYYLPKKERKDVIKEIPIIVCIQKNLPHNNFGVILLGELGHLKLDEEGFEDEISAGFEEVSEKWTKGEEYEQLWCVATALLSDHYVEEILCNKGFYQEIFLRKSEYLDFHPFAHSKLEKFSSILSDTFITSLPKSYPQNSKKDHEELLEGKSEFTSLIIFKELKKIIEELKFPPQKDNIAQVIDKIFKIYENF
jgi:hypothetical protein